MDISVELKKVRDCREMNDAQKMARSTSIAQRCDREELELLRKFYDAAPRWTSVQKAMPPVEESRDLIFASCSEIVLCTDGKEIWVAYYQIDHDEADWSKWVQRGRDGYTLENITHWMPLPEKPK